ncbi:hypothetical protein ABEG18_19165 [Alsobacter sp. KACC 23698]|uniref:Uncharacterized protein n=1 Tax=Alsobacter sp. KACC 23698 TaxID=3149229 RepID=A0AAU7JBP5_9HYPH
MMFKAVFRKGGLALGEVSIQVQSASDIEDASRDAFAELRRALPDLGLDEVGVTFMRIDPEPAIKTGR